MWNALAEEEHLGGRSSSLKRNKNKIVVRIHLRFTLPPAQNSFLLSYGQCVCKIQTLRTDHIMPKANPAVLVPQLWHPFPLRQCSGKIVPSASQSPREKKGNTKSLKDHAFQYNWKRKVYMCACIYMYMFMYLYICVCLCVRVNFFFPLNRKIVHEEIRWASCCKIAGKPNPRYGELQEMVRAAWLSYTSGSEISLWCADERISLVIWCRDEI